MAELCTACTAIEATIIAEKTQAVKVLQWLIALWRGICKELQQGGDFVVSGLARLQTAGKASLEPLHKLVSAAIGDGGDSAQTALRLTKPMDRWCDAQLKLFTRHGQAVAVGNLRALNVEVSKVVAQLQMRIGADSVLSDKLMNMAQMLEDIIMVHGSRAAADKGAVAATVAALGVTIAAAEDVIKVMDTGVSFVIAKRLSVEWAAQIQSSVDARGRCVS